MYACLCSFRTVFNYLLIAVVSGEGLPYEDIAEINEMYAVFFWYAFTILLFVLVMNMVLAIVFSTYDALREEVDENDQVTYFPVSCINVTVASDLYVQVWYSVSSPK